MTAARKLKGGGEVSSKNSLKYRTPFLAINSKHFTRRALHSPAVGRGLAVQTAFTYAGKNCLKDGEDRMAQNIPMPDDVNNIREK